MRFTCVWSPDIAPTVSTGETGPPRSTVRIYDAGNYVGFLVNERDWRCFRLLRRTLTTSGSVEEELEEVAEDWVPYSIYSEEEYPLLSEGSQHLRIPGWSLQFSPIVK
jgi:hypothetical protein